MCLFCDFVSEKEKNHLNGFPFIKIQETDNIVVFLGAPEGIIETKISDILIIPKQHFEFIEDIPKEILYNLIDKTTELAKILRKKYSSCKIFINNGYNSYQYIPHVHFHLAPRNNQKEHVFQELSLEKFKEISSQIRELLTFKNP